MTVMRDSHSEKENLAGIILDSWHSQGHGVISLQ